MASCDLLSRQQSLPKAEVAPTRHLPVRQARFGPRVVSIDGLFDLEYCHVQQSRGLAGKVRWMKVSEAKRMVGLMICFLGLLE